MLFRSNPHSKKIDIKKIQDNFYNKGNGISNAINDKLASSETCDHINSLNDGHGLLIHHLKQNVEAM